MLYPDIKLLDIFSTDSSRLAGTASNATACKITGQASSKHECSFDETNGDWIPSRNGFHCKRKAMKIRLTRNNWYHIRQAHTSIKARRYQYKGKRKPNRFKNNLTYIFLEIQAQENITVVLQNPNPVLPQNI